MILHDVSDTKMPTLNTPELKGLILDIVTYEDNVDEKGQRIRRTSYPKPLLRGVAELKKKIQDAMDIGFIPNDADPEKTLVTHVEWFQKAEMGMATPNLKPVIDRHSAKQIEITPQALQALKHYYNDRQDLPEVSEKTLDELEALLEGRIAETTLVVQAIPPTEDLPF